MFRTELEQETFLLHEQVRKSAQVLLYAIWESRQLQEQARRICEEGRRISMQMQNRPEPISPQSKGAEAPPMTLPAAS